MHKAIPGHARPNNVKSKTNIRPFSYCQCLDHPLEDHFMISARPSLDDSDRPWSWDFFEHVGKYWDVQLWRFT